MMKGILALHFALLFLAGCAGGGGSIEQQAARIHSSILTVDTHCDTPLRLDDPGFDIGLKNQEGCLDFPRMKEGGLHSEFFAVFTNQGPLDDSSCNAVHEKAVSIFNAMHRSIEENSDKAELALSADDAYRIKKSGKIAAFIGLENGYPIGKDLSRIEQFYNLGARYITLAHSRNNDICDSSTDPHGPVNGGLSVFGREVVKEMNRLGLMIDISHISDEAFFDVLEESVAPVIASHSSCRSLCGSPRNLSDDMLISLKENGGVIQICILSSFLKTPEPNPELHELLNAVRQKYGDYNALSEDSKVIMMTEYKTVQRKHEKLATVQDIADHIDHAVQVAGIDHVGIGTDFDGGGRVEGCMDASQVQNITIELLSRGYTKPQIEKIWGGNIMRVMREVENLATKNLSL